MSRGFSVLDHVADVEVKAWAGDFEGVFSEMSKGMWFVMAGEATIPSSHTWIIEVKGVDMEDLLVHFLNEQLALLDMDGLVVSTINEIAFEESRDGEEIGLKSVARGAHVSDLDEPMNLEIKAATFHGLQLTPTEARVTFDV